MEQNPLPKPVARFAEKMLALSRPKRRGSEPEAAPGITYASFNRRMVAALIDSILVILLLAPPLELIVNMTHGSVSLDLGFINQRLQEAPPEMASQIWLEELRNSGLLDRWLFASFLQLGLLGLVTVLFWDWRSATPGKMLCRIAVLDAKTLRPISNTQSLVRFFAYFVSTLPLMLGFFAVSWSKKRQAWHDVIAGTVAVVLPKGKKANELSDE